MIDFYTDFQSAIKRLKSAAKAYHTDGSSPLSDVEYDILLAQVGEAMENHPSWDVSDLNMVAEGGASGDTEHLAPMLSLQKVFSKEALRAWFDKVERPEFSIEPKLDGNAVGLMYHFGTLAKVLTRGDGTKGEDITEKAKDLLVVPEYVPMFCDDEWVEVRGEAILLTKNFNLINDRSGGAYSKARNAVAGIMRGGYDLDYPFIDFFAYDVYPDFHPDYSAEMALLRGQGFETTGMDEVATTWEEVWAGVEAVRQTLEEGAFAMETDGVVIKQVNHFEREEMGATSKFPRWAIAYKFQPEQTTSFLRDVEWQVGRTGRITPRAVIDPVNLDGAVITYATLHNPEFIRAQGLTIDGEVVVYRAGEVIPRVVGTGNSWDGTREIDLPTDCPRCGGEIDSTGGNLRCVNGAKCGLVELISHAVSRDILDIDGLAKKHITKFVNAGFIEDVADIFSLLVVPEEFWAELGIPYTYNGKPIKEYIDAAKDQPAWKFLAALGIEMVGRTLSKQALQNFPELLLVGSSDERAAYYAVGEGVKADKLAKGLEDNFYVLDKLADHGINLMGEAKAEGPLTGKTIVITGSFDGITRNEIATKVEALGGKVSSSISKKTNYLIAGEKAGSKATKAEQLGVPVVGLDLLNN